MKPPRETAPTVDEVHWDESGEPSPEWRAAVRPAGTTRAKTTSESRGSTLVDVEHIFGRWIHGTDLVPTRALLAAYLANHHFDGDPIWLMLVGGSGIGKTERLNALAALPDVVLESSISGPAALLSGTGKKERAKDASGGVLRKFLNGHGILVLKDFTSVLEMHREARAEILAAFREIYDGRWDRSVGADGGRTLTWQGRIGLIAGCTTAIDSAHAVMSAMGTRFVLMRLRGDEQLAHSVLDHVGREQEMREALREAAGALLLHPPGRPHELTDTIKGRIAALGSYVAAARSPVDRDHQGEIRLVLDAEAPTRIVKMLAQLWRAAGLLGLDAEDAWAVVERVGMDSIPKLRLSALRYLRACISAATTTEIAEAVEHPSRTTRRALEDLTAHRVVERDAGGSGKADRWMLTERAQQWLDRLSGTLPDPSDPTHSPLIQNKKTKTDIFGKVGANKDRPESTPEDDDGSF